MSTHSIFYNKPHNFKIVLVLGLLVITLFTFTTAERSYEQENLQHSTYNEDNHGHYNSGKQITEENSHESHNSNEEYNQIDQEWKSSQTDYNKYDINTQSDEGQQKEAREFHLEKKESTSSNHEKVTYSEQNSNEIQENVKQDYSKYRITESGEDESLQNHESKHFLGNKEDPTQVESVATSLTKDKVVSGNEEKLQVYQQNQNSNASSGNSSMTQAYHHIFITVLKISAQPSAYFKTELYCYFVFKQNFYSKGQNQRPNTNNPNPESGYSADAIVTGLFCMLMIVLFGFLIYLSTNSYKRDVYSEYYLKEKYRV